MSSMLNLNILFSFMQYKHVYNPPSNVSEIVDEAANEFGLTSENGGKFESLDLKAKVNFILHLIIRLVFRF